MKKKIIWGTFIAALLIAAAWGPVMSRVEQAKYKVVETSGDAEIREYAPMIVAETQVEGARDEAINQGFRLIADYIFGNNAPAEKVAMTAPVIQEPTKIAMTAPVTQQAEGGAWKVRFVMPSNYTMETLPKPNNDAVVLHEVPAKKFAVVRFAGTSSEANLKEHTDVLLKFVESKSLNALSAPTYAFYNPPWTLPFLRRNEVMVEVE